MKRLVDLTQLFSDDMPVYPGDPCARLYQTASISKDGLSDHRIETGMHVGTHIDAPLHMCEGGAYICDIPLTHFQGKGHLIDARGLKTISGALLDGVDLQAGDIVLIWTNWSDRFREADYYHAYPSLEEDFALRLVKAKVALVGMDTPGPDYEPFPIHKILLPSTVLIIENMTNLAALEGQAFKIYAYPMKLKADAAPVRVVAEI